MVDPARDATFGMYRDTIAGRLPNVLTTAIGDMSSGGRNILP